MFFLAEMKDTVRIKPALFNMKLHEAVSEQLNKKLANKVMVNVGLCITLFDITKLEDSFIFPGDGASHTRVHFRYVVYRPFLDEILVGTIRCSSREGVHVSLGFFDDILIPPDQLQHPSRFDEQEQVWVWEYEADDGKHDMFMDREEKIRFRVISESFVDTSPSGPETSEISDGQDGEKKVPYTLMGSISEPGLGLLSWWSNEDSG